MGFQIEVAFKQCTQRHSKIFHWQTTHPALKYTSLIIQVTHLPKKDNFTFPHINLQSGNCLETYKSHPNVKQSFPRSITK